MRFWQIIGLALVSVSIGANTSLAQDGALGACLARAGTTDEAAFVAFDHELRSALAAPDPAILALLAAYPLRVNQNGTTSIHDARTLSERATRVFPPALRTKVLATATKDLVCTSNGIGYGSGALWVGVADGPLRFAIQAVNLDDAPGEPAESVLFVCRADGLRALVDRGASGTLRYRAWTRPRPATERPDVELTPGQEDMEGTGPCVHRVWRFGSGRRRVEVRELGCLESAPPAGSLGLLAVETPGAKRARLWCY